MRKIVCVILNLSCKIICKTKFKISYRFDFSWISVTNFCMIRKFFFRTQNFFWTVNSSQISAWSNSHRHSTEQKPITFISKCTFASHLPAINYYRLLFRSFPWIVDCWLCQKGGHERHLYARRPFFPTKSPFSLFFMIQLIHK